jgi:endoglucanase
MLRAWEDFPGLHSIALALPESGGALPDFLDEVKFETDWLLTMQAADGSVYTKVSTERFGAFVLPEKEITPRFVCPWGTPATADFVAMMAQAARAFRPFLPDYAARCLAAARKSAAFLAAHPEDHAPDQSAFHTGGYGTSDPDDRLWAAAELWETTGDPAELKNVETLIRTLAPTFVENFDWADVKDPGLLAYLFSERDGRDPTLVAKLRKSLVAVAETIVGKARANGYARPLGSHYYWGGNGGVARQTLLLQGAFRLTKNNVFRETSLDAVNHLFGRNVDGRSYVTGLGFRPPQNPHDRRSGGDDVDRPWPGYLVGGPHPTARDWHDVLADARTNEIAINWNAALIYALAGFLPNKETAAH